MIEGIRGVSEIALGVPLCEDEISTSSHNRKTKRDDYDRNEIAFDVFSRIGACLLWFASSLFSLSMIYKIPINCAFIVFDAPFDPTYFLVQGLAQLYFPVHKFFPGKVPLYHIRLG